MNDWIQTYTGKQFHFLDPRPDEICIEDIAHALANTCRYGGHTARFYSVAEHSVYVSCYALPDHALYALLHDAAEAYLGDTPSPLKYYANQLAHLERKIAAVIYRALNVPTPPEAVSAVHILDQRIVGNERAALMAPPPAAWHPTGEPLDRLRIEGLPPIIAQQYFLAAFHALTHDRYRAAFPAGSPTTGRTIPVD
jgi:hypothetical protein